MTTSNTPQGDSKAEKAANKTMQFRTPIIGDLQARLSAPGLIGDPVEGGKYVIDIVQWAKDYSHCWTVAIIEPKAESPDMRSIGNRLLDVDWQALEKVVRISYSFMEAL